MNALLHTIDHLQTEQPAIKKGRKQKDSLVQVENGTVQQVTAILKSNYLQEVPDETYGLIFIHSKLFMARLKANLKSFAKWIKRHLAKKGKCITSIDVHR